MTLNISKVGLGEVEESLFEGEMWWKAKINVLASTSEEALKRVEEDHDSLLVTEFLGVIPIEGTLKRVEGDGDEVVDRKR